MHERDETMLFSAIAILLATLTLGSLVEFASANAQAVTNAGELRLSRYSACAATATAPAARSAADRQG